jgi:hypothetical protein
MYAAMVTVSSSFLKFAPSATSRHTKHSAQHTPKHAKQ